MAVIAALFASVSADQPVHCLLENVKGTWEFDVANEDDTVDLFKTKEVCTHKIPNGVQAVPAGYEFTFGPGAKTTKYRFNLGDDYKATMQKCSESGKCEGAEVNGTWSTIYDQGMRILLEDGMRIVTNFRYNIKSNESKNPWIDGADALSAEVSRGTISAFDSDCSKTMVGFLQHANGENRGTMKNHKVECAVGKMIEHKSSNLMIQETSDTATILANKDTIKAEFAQQEQEKAAEAPAAQAPEEQTMLQLDDDVKQPEDELNLLLEQFLMPHGKVTRENLHQNHKPSDETDLLIETINKLAIGWDADVCKLQKHHASYGSHCDSQKSNLAQKGTEESLDLEEKVFGQGDDFPKAWEQALSFKKQYNKATDIPTDQLPDNFDWRNVGGHNFLGDVRDQGGCGSCYTVSFVQIMEHKLRMQKGTDQAQVSPQQAMMCNYLNEGCDGGWPLFHGFYGENAYFVKEECAQYKAKTKGDRCSNYEKCEPYVKVTDTKYIGKGYGAATEEAIMKEIIHSGAINGEIQFPRVASFYKKGIITENGIAGLHKAVVKLAQLSDNQKSKLTESHNKISKKTMMDRGVEWQKLNHSITVIGWGTDPQTQMKYWIIRNSYGELWGDQGDFLAERGVNFMNIESEATAYEAGLCSEMNC